MKNGFEAIQEEALMHPVFPGVVFGLMVKQGDKPFDIVFTDKQSIAAGTAFRDFINERMEDEK